MVPQLETVAAPYSIPVYSTGGFSSVTVTYEIAERALARDKPTVFLHVGDYDPSGESIFEAMTRDARAFLYNRLVWKLEREAGSNQHSAAILERHWPGRTLYPAVELPENFADLRPTRVALTEDQVDEYALPTAPPKVTDTRSRNWSGETCQLEAMPPDLLAEVIDGAIRDVLDLDAIEDVTDTERSERTAMIERVTAVIAEHENE